MTVAVLTIMAGVAAQAQVQHLKLQALMEQAHRSLLDFGNHSEAARLFEEVATLARRPPATDDKKLLLLGPGAAPSKARAVGRGAQRGAGLMRHKLRHDAEQLALLLELNDAQLERGLVGWPMRDRPLATRAHLEQTLSDYEEVLAEVGSFGPADTSEDDAERLTMLREVSSLGDVVRREYDVQEGDVVQLSAEQAGRIAHWHNRLSYLEPMSEPADALGTADFEAAEQQFTDGTPSLTVIDDTLSSDTLAQLLAYAQRSTVWFDSRPGYLGAYLTAGFGAAPLMSSLAEALRARMPRVFCEHRLTTWWMYKYDSALASGIGIHADQVPLLLLLLLTLINCSTETTIDTGPPCT